MMKELEAYVNRLFIKYPKTKSINELKAEILSNLEAKKADLMAGGLDENTAIQKAKDSITSIDALIDGNKTIYINQYRLELLQQSLLYLLIAWIITIPFTLFQRFLTLNLLLFFFVLAVGTAYLLNKTNKSETYLEKRQYVNINHYLKMKRTVWLIWGIFVALCTIAITGLYFGSNLWFSRPVHIEGPYIFALMVTRYLAPFVSIIIPLIIHQVPKLLMKYEAGENDEQ